MEALKILIAEERGSYPGTRTGNGFFLLHLDCNSTYNRGQEVHPNLECVPRVSFRSWTAVAFLTIVSASLPARASIPEPPPLTTPISWWDSLLAYPLSLFQSPEPAHEVLNIQLPAPPPPFVEACAVEPIPPIEDLAALDFEDGASLDTKHLHPETARALTRFEQKVSAVGGSMTLTSAYRPASYQEHLMAVWDKWSEMQVQTNPACNSLRAQIDEEFNKHALLATQRPVAVSDHTLGVGFDAMVLLPEDVEIRRKPVDVDDLAKLCRLMRPDPLRDYVHFRLSR